ncbi:hypothetical protein AB1Y20_001014 [Prymnesium parvum]|uniref:Uncharacterized protein n=1 Tax=Prymnesium parvum TaxID=97485 RepID=A0AB34K9M6_PRYPA
MVLLVPPLLEELGADAKRVSRQALAAWQRELWNAAQRLREREEPEVDFRWMGTLEQLSSVLAGSVVIGGGEDAPDVVPIASDTMPAVKGSPEDPLVRLESTPGLSGRYAQLSVVIGSSVAIWPAVISVDGTGGQNAHCLRSKGGRSVLLQVVVGSHASLGFRLVDPVTKSVVATSENVNDIAQHAEGEGVACRYGDRHLRVSRGVAGGHDGRDGSGGVRRRGGHERRDKDSKRQEERRSPCCDRTSALSDTGGGVQRSVKRQRAMHARMLRLRPYVSLLLLALHVLGVPCALTSTKVPMMGAFVLARPTTSKHALLLRSPPALHP